MSALRANTGFSPHPMKATTPVVLDPERVELVSNELTRPVLFEPVLWVLMDPPPDVSHPLEELRSMAHLSKPWVKDLSSGSAARDRKKWKRKRQQQQSERVPFGRMALKLNAIISLSG
ncbi:hypothetical protein NL676_001942 [Syzygium grande]|nr:hypothetical protein NL676_001942 [Syzygium grande]